MGGGVDAMILSKNPSSILSRYFVTVFSSLSTHIHVQVTLMVG